MSRRIPLDSPTAECPQCELIPEMPAIYECDLCDFVGCSLCLEFHFVETGHHEEHARDLELFAQFVREMN